MSFLQDNYKVPQSGDNYMKFEKGDNVFRVLTDAITGWEYWVEETDDKGVKKRKPIRVRTKEELPASTLKVAEPTQLPKHFWAFGVQDRQAQDLADGVFQEFVPGFWSRGRGCA